MSKPQPDTSVVKVCCTCKEAKPRSDFWKHRKNFDGLQSSCSQCQGGRHHSYITGDRVSNAARAKSWRERNPERAADHYAKFQHGVPLGTYAKMLADQDGRCAICNTDDPAPRTRFHIDHCHGSGVIRGLLCHHCNVGIGHLREDPKIISKAIDYLLSAKGRIEG